MREGIGGEGEPIRDQRQHQDHFLQKDVGGAVKPHIGQLQLGYWDQRVREYVGEARGQGEPKCDQLQQ